MDEPSTRNVQPSYGKDLLESALLAVAVSVIIILLYITIRFKVLGFTAAIAAIISLHYDFNFYKNFISNEILNIRELTYKAEKIVRYANKNKKTAFLDERILKEPYLYEWKKDIEAASPNAFYDTNYYIIYLNYFEKTPITSGIIYTQNDVAEREFKANGGNFGTEELKNIKFTNLLKI